MEWTETELSLLHDGNATNFDIQQKLKLMGIDRSIKDIGAMRALRKQQLAGDPEHMDLVKKNEQFVELLRKAHPEREKGG